MKDKLAPNVCLLPPPSQERCFSWCKTNNCLFVDQPVQAGFSFQTDATSGKPIINMDKVDFTDTSPGAMKQVPLKPVCPRSHSTAIRSSKHMHTRPWQVHGVVSQFLGVFPELRSAPLIITGEVSPRGVCVPLLPFSCWG